MLVCLGAGMMLLQACKKDTPEISNPELPILQEARSYFESQVLTGKNKRDVPSISKVNGGLRQFLSKNAIWEIAYIKKISIGDAVIVPLHYNKTMYTKVGKDKQSVSLDNLSYLMMYKTPQGEMTAELVT